MIFTGIRAIEYETLKMFRSSFTRKEYTDAYQALVKREKAAQKQAAKRAAGAAAREAAREAALEAAEAKREAEREAKREAARVARNLKAQEKRKYAVHITYNFVAQAKDAETGLLGAPFNMLPRDEFFEAPYSKIKEEAKKAYDKYIDYLDEESQLVVVKSGSSYTITSATKVVGTSVSKASIGMQAAGSLFLDGEEHHEFDTGQGTCVFDWIIKRYGPIRGCIKTATKESLVNILGSEALENGVSAIALNAVCDVLHCRQYALDETNQIIHAYKPEKLNNNVPPLVYRVKNGHFHPVVKEATSICQMGRATNQAQKGKEEEKEAKTLEIVLLPLPEDKKNKYAQVVQICKEQNVEVYGRGFAPLRYSDEDLVSFELSGKMYLWGEDDMIAAAKKIYEMNGLPYDGSTIPGMINKAMAALNLTEKSAPNPHVMDVLMKAKNRVHYGRLEKPAADEWAADIIKCYSSCIMVPTEEFYIYGSTDEWAPWDHKLLPGLYFVETSDMRLFHGSNVYSLAMIQRAKTAGIQFTIRSQLRPSKILPKTYFAEMVGQIRFMCKDDISLMKWFFNIFVGMLGKSSRNSITARMDTDRNTVWEDYNSDKPGKPFITTHDGYYFYGRNHKIELAEHNVPIWIQILDWSNIKLFDLVSEVEASGGVLVARKTDCAVFVGGSLTERFVVGGVRFCEIPEMKAAKTAEQRSLSSAICESDDWNTAAVHSSSQIEEATTAIMENGGALLTGYAGTGKTYLAKKIAETFDGPILRMAPTNKAALNIGGRTIHKELKIDMSGKFNLKGLRRKYGSGRVLIIVDEASMIGSQLWRKLVELKKALPKSIWLMLGDEGQCRPVGEEDSNFFESSLVKYLAANLKLDLTEIQRYDPKLAELALAIRSGLSFEKRRLPGAVSNDRGRVMGGRHLCYFNRTRKWLNSVLNEKRGFFLAAGEEEGSQDAHLYAGCPIIATRNYSKSGQILCVNAEQFTIRSVTVEKLVVVSARPEGEFVWELETADFHKWFHLNFASTVHKSQGDTLSGPVTIWDHDAMDKRILYTAVTRAKAYDQIYFA